MTIIIEKNYIANFHQNNIHELSSWTLNKIKLLLTNYYWKQKNDKENIYSSLITCSLLANKYAYKQTKPQRITSGATA